MILWVFPNVEYFCEHMERPQSGFKGKSRPGHQSSVSVLLFKITRQLSITLRNFCENFSANVQIQKFSGN